MPLNRSQAKGIATQQRRAALRLAKVRELSKEGVSYSDTYKSLGMTRKGLDSLLYRTYGTSKWPIIEGNS